MNELFVHDFSKSYFAYNSACSRKCACRCRTLRRGGDLKPDKNIVMYYMHARRDITFNSILKPLSRTYRGTRTQPTESRRS